MKPPLKTMIVTPGGAFGVKRVGSGLPDKNGVLRHIGVDLRASVGTKVYAPEAGIVTLVDDVGLKLVEIRIGEKLHRFLHLDDNILKKGQKVKQGQLIGYSGNTGNVAAHLHWDVRRAGTIWDTSYYNYEDPMKLIKEEEEDMPSKADITDMFGLLDKKPTAKQYAGYAKQPTINLAKDIGNVLYGKNKELKAALEKCKKQGPESNDQALKDGIFNKIKGVFGK